MRVYRAVEPRQIYLMLNEKKNAFASQVSFFEENLSSFEELKQFQ